MSQPSLEGPADSGLEEDRDLEECVESGCLSPTAMNTVVQVHRHLCLGYARSLWYQSTATANHNKEPIKALVSSYQIAAPVMSRFYHLIGWYLCMMSLESGDLSSIFEQQSRNLHVTLKWEVDYDSGSVSPSDAELDQQLAGSELLLSALLQNTVQGSGGPDGLVVASEGSYDFYQQPNMSEACLCLPVLKQLSVAVKQRLDEWPDHPALVQVS